jgi:ATP/maltotriose-dependent transcriptional regulator MalT
LLRAQIAFASTRGRDAPPLLLAAAKRLEPLDATLARETYLDAFAAALSADRLARGGDAREVAAAVVAAGWEPSTRACDLLLDGLALRYAEGCTAASRPFKQALRAFRDARLSEDEELRWLWLACHIARELGDDEAWDELTARQLQLARRAGAFALLPIALDNRFSVELLTGRLAEATSLAAEADAVVEATGGHLVRRTGIALASWHGRDAEARALTEAHREEVLRRGEGLWLTANDWGIAVLYNALGRYDEALAVLERVAENPEGTGLSIWVAAEFVEAAVRSGNAQRAFGPLARLTEIAEANGNDWSLGLRAARAAMVEEGEAAEQLYREAIERFSRTRIRIGIARSHLLYGEWLRRENRRVDAREHLRLAHELFSEIGNEPFAERARRELLATGETVRKRTVETLDELTPQELQIGRMAAEGFTNPEIGAQLFLSPRTVEWHLRKVFGKLGISSRRQLRSAMPGARATAVAV